MHILKNKIFYYNLLLISIILLIGYKVFLSNKISIQQSVNLTNKEIYIISTRWQSVCDKIFMGLLCYL